MGCSSCGGSKIAARTPGGTARHPIIFGEKDARVPQTATFLVDTDGVKRGEYRYVAGDGVEAAVEAGTIVLGFAPSSATSTRAPRVKKMDDPPEFYVRTGRNRWNGFKNKESAERYAKATGGAVVSRDDVLKERKGK